MLLPNPPWIDRLLHTYWERLSAAVSPESLPKLGKGRKFEEFGTGHYGSVYPTSIPGLVCKVTSDADEARVVQFILQNDLDLPGMVKYTGVVEIPGVAYRKRRVFVLWREEARDYNAETLLGHLPDRYEVSVFQQAFKWLQNYKDVSHMVRMTARANQRAFSEALSSQRIQERAWDKAAEIYDDGAELYRLMYGRSFSPYGISSTPRRTYYKYPSERIAIGLVVCRFISEQMLSSPGFPEIGDALFKMQDAGMLLADVHRANIGLAYREDYAGLVPVIRDPGHALPLTPEAASVVVPTLA